MTQKIAPLQVGDTVALISTARTFDAASLQPAIALLHQWGLIGKVGRSIGARQHQFAGDDDLRAADLQMMLDDDNIKAIWFAKGGYGTVRILDKVDFSRFYRLPKWLIGYSDLTALFGHIAARRSRLPLLHATMPTSLANTDMAALDALKNTLFGEKMTYHLPPHPLQRDGVVQAASLIGGNLSVLYSLLGSSSEANWKGKILFLEDIDEYLYHIDRMMCNLQRSGKLAQLAALVVGGFTDMNDNSVAFGKSAEAIIAEHCSSYQFPVAFGMAAGHQSNNFPLKLGALWQLHVMPTGATLKEL